MQDTSGIWCERGFVNLVRTGLSGASHLLPIRPIYGIILPIYGNIHPIYGIHPIYAL